MAIFTPIKNQKQTKGALLGTMLYAINKKKTTCEGQSLISGFNCSAYTSYLEMMTMCWGVSPMSTSGSRPQNIPQNRRNCGRNSPSWRNGWNGSRTR